ncbi:MAG: hypothetical protein ACYCQK_02050 [Acidiferrobacteraceae bacterium]
MALIDDYAASLDPRVIAQVTAAIHAAAANVYGEASTVTGHTTRAAFANKVATGQVQLQPLILDACSFASLSAASTDSTVSNAVSALWNEWAGV